MAEYEDFWEEAPNHVRDAHLSYVNAITGADDVRPELKAAVTQLVLNTKQLIAYRSSKDIPAEISFNHSLLKDVNSYIGSSIENLLQEAAVVTEAVIKHRNEQTS